MNFDNFYPSIIKKAKFYTDPKETIMAWHFGATGVVDTDNLEEIASTNSMDKVLWIGFFDAEPMIESSIEEITKVTHTGGPVRRRSDNEKTFLFATSDWGHDHVDNIIHNWQTLVPTAKVNPKIWYYFFHGFVALDWFREYRLYDCELILNNRKFEHSYITMNRLVDESRNYRLILGSMLGELNILDKGLCSFTKYNHNNGNYPLPPDIESDILKHHSESLRFDLQGEYIDNDSMHINIHACMSSFLHVVTETCFYQNFNHLTEKVFKPIVMMQPFVLVGTHGSLEYLKKYGFKTFDRWIDESYDCISDPVQRLEKIAKEIEKITLMSPEEQEEMYKEMTPVLLHNRRHFYKDFYDIINEEMWTNFQLAIKKT